MDNSGLTKILNNWKVVLLCFGGAATFWFFNALNKDYNARIDYPLTFEFDKDSVVIMRRLPDFVKIDVSSGGWNLLRRTFWFNAKPVIITLDNPTDIKFLTRFSLLPTISDQLNELKINYLVTDTLYLDIEPKKSKKVKLAIDSSFIDLADNYRIISALVLQPDSVTIYGPQSIVDNIQSPYLVSFGEEDVDDDIDESVDVPLIVDELMRAEPEEINLKFDVARFERVKTTLQPELLNFPSDSSVYLETEEVEISYTIRRSLREDFSESDFALTIDLDMIQKEDSTVQVLLIYYPEQVMELEINPEIIRVLYASK
ncbi:MAG: hypothetical protein KI790_04690 [Cyclobacteriaceae bacterium]|nr:hypothetical protein [Cyclobacteriaceae bacterium HetDA_MAG_MS6]